MTKQDINAILMELSVLKNDMYHFRQDMERRAVSYTHLRAHET